MGQQPIQIKDTGDDQGDAGDQRHDGVGMDIIRAVLLGKLLADLFLVAAGPDGDPKHDCGGQGDDFLFRPEEYDPFNGHGDG